MQFDFGENWAGFSASALTKEKIDAARKEFLDLLDGCPLSGKSFLDIGFGQGMSLLFAAEMKADAKGCDINPKCDETLKKNKQNFFSHLSGVTIPVVVGSILVDGTVDEIRKGLKNNSGNFDIVHSWGVLHHTGNMKLAIENSHKLVNPNGGIFVIAIYNRHWTSPIWKFIKWVYCMSPSFLKKIYIALFYPLIWIAKFAVTGKNPKNQQRGMDFYYNVIDWIGGYPYEYAGLEEMKKKIEKMGYTCTKAIPAEVPIGCNQFVFVKNE